MNNLREGYPLKQYFNLSKDFCSIRLLFRIIILTDQYNLKASTTFTEHLLYKHVHTVNNSLIPEQKVFNQMFNFQITEIKDDSDCC